MSENKNQSRPYGEDIKSGTTDSVLASMFRTVLHDLGITPSRFDRLLDRYVDSIHVTNVKEASSQKGNLRKELLKSSMSWKVFVKGLVFLNIKKFEIVVNLTHVTGEVTVHNKVVSLTQYKDDYSATDNNVNKDDE
jgi:hypothetical protein